MEPGYVWGRGVLVVLMVVLSSYTDLRYQKIRNVHTFPAMCAGLLLGGLERGWSGLGWAGAGLGLGLLLMGVLFVLGVMKAGDVKLAMALGALCGPGEIFRGVILSFMLYLPVGVATLMARSGVRNLWKALKRIGWLVYTAIHPLLKMAPLDEKGMTMAPFGMVLGVAVLLVHFADWLNWKTVWGQ
ncbi:MAG: prepilin peptidase [Calditrichaeota bacterium]|nr:MAG: prepilin peptidase [Calditrichota bacterium]